MSILRFFKKVDPIPSEDDSALSELLGLNVLKEVNTEMRNITGPSRGESPTPGTSGSATKTPGSTQRKKYAVYSPSTRAAIGKYCAENGPASTLKKFASSFPNLNESLARHMRSKFLDTVKSNKHKLDFSDVTEVHNKKRGRPLLLGTQLDDKVKNYVKVLRSNGAVINTTIVMAAGKGIVKATDPSLLNSQGGSIEITRAWAKSLMSRMNLVKRKGSTACKADKIENFEELKSDYLQHIEKTVDKYDIHPSMIINWDHAGLNIVPVSDWTMEEQGKRRVEISGLGDKRQVTAVFAGTLTGEFLPPQVIYGGKTSRCHPKYEFPKEWHITHSDNHWANEETQMDYVRNIVFPYLNAARQRLKLSPKARALCIFDVFRAQMTEDFRDLLKSKHIEIVYVPPNCTDRLQPLDISVQKSVKASLEKSFEEWYSKQIMEQMSDENQDDIVINPVQMPMTKMRELFSKWMLKMYHEIKTNPGLITSGFRSAGIIAALEDCIPLNSFVKG